MHVLFLPKWYPHSGDPQLGDPIRKQALALSRHTATSVLFVHAIAYDAVTGVIVRRDDGPLEVFSTYRGSSSACAPIRKAVNFFRWWSAANRGWRTVLREAGTPDLLHVHVLVRPALFARRSGVPYVITEHSSEYITGAYARANRLKKALHRWLFGRARAVVVVSEHLGRALVDHGLCRTFRVVPNVVPGLDLSLPPAGSPLRFLVVADLVDAVKNISGVLRALEKARSSDPGIHLGIIGDGPDRAMLEKMAATPGLAGAVTFHGRITQAEVMEHMARTGAVIVNSHVETFSVVTGEALALGRPVIATRCGGPEAFISPGNGILIDRDDDAALATAMLRIASGGSPADPATIRTTLADRYTPDAVASALMATYASVVHGK